MELSYWQSKWQKGKIGFHMEDGYPGLEKYWDSIPLSNNPTTFVPLCGKSKDLLWLAKHCKRVVGVEISDLAVEQFLNENSLDAEISTFGDFTIYRAHNIEIWNGDFFKLPKHKLPTLDLVFDRAALVALPQKKRILYAEKILELTSDKTIILQHMYHYRQEEMSGPPFSVSTEELEDLYGKEFQLQILENNELNLDFYKKFKNRGLRSYFIEILSLLLPIEELQTK
ncbi:MAG: thiopurine S-methyltransferase, partial [Bacteroidetes bacterium]|jgi:thiopurine S-methyltransferase|nr:thiopurine S-methyltransferase [Bacteroidota bacterium]